jgi:hypothetical protein
MTCEDAPSLIASLLDRSLDDASRIRLEAHLRGCAVCQDRVDRKVRLETLLRLALPVPDPGDAHFEEQRRRVLTGLKSRRPRWGASLRLIAAASVAAAALLMVIKGPGTGRTPAPANTPAPRPIVERPVHPQETPELKPAVEPPVRPVVPSEPSAGTAERTMRMSRESVDIALAETPSERVLALCAAAEAQLRDLAEAIVKDPALASELAGAYRLLVGEGVARVLDDRAETEQDLASARMIAARRARDHEATLAALSDRASGPLKGQLALALEASRAVSGH